ncbi:MAG: hypothetical protein HYZ81_02115 [Nitrospinae bacterium]|nr:hypothetical protein [Nitrospinota bacterium]
MISLVVYKNVHLLGVVMILLALGGLILHRIIGGTRAHAWRKPVAITHGVGLLLALVSGFGMLARLGIYWPIPGWVIGKIVIWLVFGALVAVIFRSSALAKSLWWVTIVLAGLAGYLALNKPF